MPRQARIDYEGALHHIIGRGIERKHIFKDEKNKAEFHRRLSMILSSSSMKCHAWCIMGNHFHLLLQTGVTPLKEVMRRLLTGYAIYYNKVNKRSGHLFENRYKSIVCEKESYLLLLIRYIHLNPVRVGIVKFENLIDYKWTGHREILNRINEGLIDRDEVLSYFGDKEGKAKKNYETFLGEGIGLKEDYSGGGLKRSMGGFSKALKTRGKDRQEYDERILGQGSFVGEVLKKSGQEKKAARTIKDIDDLLDKISRYYGVTQKDILKSRVKRVREARCLLVFMGCEFLKKSGKEMGEILKITTEAASIARRKGSELADSEGIVQKLLS
ncbi:transposase [Candidatus Desantisbacteria bacterium]|nr:transposase [Candidatus Desantisbacteria bacterium]